MTLHAPTWSNKYTNSNALTRMNKNGNPNAPLQCADVDNQTSPNAPTWTKKNTNQVKYMKPKLTCTALTWTNKNITIHAF